MNDKKLLKKNVSVRIPMELFGRIKVRMARINPNMGLQDLISALLNDFAGETYTPVLDDRYGTPQIPSDDSKRDYDLADGAIKGNPDKTGIEPEESAETTVRRTRAVIERYSGGEKGSGKIGTPVHSKKRQSRKASDPKKGVS